MDIDELDKKIIQALQKNDLCGPKVTEIAEDLDVPNSTVHSRIKNMEGEELINGYSADIDAEKAGKPLTVFALVKLEYPKSSKEVTFDEDTASRISRSSDQIQEIHAMTGEWELLIKIKVRDADDYYRIAKNHIVPAGDIKKVKGLFALNTEKETSKIYP